MILDMCSLFVTKGYGMKFGNVTENTAELENERTTKRGEEVNYNETILIVIAAMFLVGALLQQLTINKMAKLIKELLQDRINNDN
jgi:hypothetical protein